MIAVGVLLISIVAIGAVFFFLHIQTPDNDSRKTDDPEENGLQLGGINTLTEEQVDETGGSILVDEPDSALDGM